MHFRLFIQSWPTLKHQYEQYRMRKRMSKRNLHGTFPTVFLLEMVAMPLLTGIFIAHAATDENFGVTAGLSIVFSIAFTIYLFLIAQLETTLFRHFVVGTAGLGTRKDAANVAKYDRIALYCGTFFYTGINTAANVAGIFLPLGATPARIGIAVGKNVGTMLYFGWYSAHHHEIKKRILEIVDSTREDVRLNRALIKIDESINMANKRVVIMFLLLAMFSVVPQLLSFQYFVTSFLLGIACGEWLLLCTSFLRLTNVIDYHPPAGGNHALRQLASGENTNPSSDGKVGGDHLTVISTDRQQTEDKVIPLNSHESIYKSQT